MTKPNAVPRTEMVLREVRPGRIDYDATIGGYPRMISVRVRGRVAMFPHVESESGESTGWPQIDAQVRQRAQQTLTLGHGLRSSGW